MKVGRYLARYFKDVLSTEEIKEWADLHRQENADYEIQWASTQEEIEYVYTHGPRSCMSGGASDYSTGGIHPSRVYAGGGTKIAYLKKRDRIVARTVVNIEEKQFVSIYGDSDVLETLLEEAGYEWGSLEGCNLLLIKTDSGRIVMPYLDGDCDRYDVIDDSYILVCDGGDYCADTTNGLSDAHNTRYCSCCDDHYDEDEGSYVESYGDWVCDSCIDVDFIYATADDGTDVLVINDEDVVSTEDGKVFVDHDAAYENDYSQCVYDGDWYPTSDMVEDVDGDIIHRDNAIMFIDSDGDERYATKNCRDDYYEHDGVLYEEPQEEDEDED